MVNNPVIYGVLASILHISVSVAVKFCFFALCACAGVVEAILWVFYCRFEVKKKTNKEYYRVLSTG